jgi:hypothetical protein
MAVMGVRVVVLEQMETIMVPGLVGGHMVIKRYPHLSGAQVVEEGEFTKEMVVVEAEQSSSLPLLLLILPDR